MTSDPNLLLGPLQELFSTAIGPGGPTLQPCLAGGLLAAAAGPLLTALAPDTGQVRWQRELHGTIDLLAGTDRAVVVGVMVEGITELIAFDLRGDELWRLDRDWAVGRGNMRGAGDRLIVLGRDHGPDKSPVCCLLDPETGASWLEFPCEGDCPEPLGKDLVYSVRSPGAEEAGLYRVDLNLTARVATTTRLRAESHSLRAVTEELILIDTYDRAEPRCRLIALDPNGGRALWEVPGGPNLRMAIGGDQVGGVELVAPRQVCPVLRDSASGTVTHRGQQTNARFAATLLTNELWLVWLDMKRLWVHRRADGARLQTLEYSTGLTKGGLLTDAGLFVVAYDLKTTRVSCLRSAERSAAAAVPQISSFPSSPSAAREDALDGRSYPWTDGYVLVVALQYLFHFGPVWHRLTDRDPGLRADEIRSVFEQIRQLGIELERDAPAELSRRYGDRKASAARSLVARLYAYVERIRRAGALVFANDAAELPLLCMCVANFPREHLGIPERTLVVADEVQILELGPRRGEPDVSWGRRSDVTRFLELQFLSLSQCELGPEPLGIDLGRLDRLRVLDLSLNELECLPEELLACHHLEWLDVGDNPLEPDALEPLARISGLKYLRVARTRVNDRTIRLLRDSLAGGVLETEK